MAGPARQEGASCDLEASQTNAVLDANSIELEAAVNPPAG